MDDELKQALAAMEARIEAMQNRLMSRLDETDERIEATETKLLKAFYDWARPVESRLN